MVIGICYWLSYNNDDRYSFQGSNEPGTHAVVYICPLLDVEPFRGNESAADQEEDETDAYLVSNEGLSCSTDAVVAAV